MESEGNIFTCLKPALSSSLLSISSIIITIAKNKNLSPAGFSHKKTGQLVQTAFFSCHIPIKCFRLFNVIKMSRLVFD